MPQISSQLNLVEKVKTKLKSKSTEMGNKYGAT